MPADCHPGRIAAILAVSLSLGLGGCCSLPPSAATGQPREPFPARFQGRQTLVFEFQPVWWWPQKARLAAVGYASVDRTARTCRVTCLSPMGLKLFDLDYTNGVSRLDTGFPLPGDAARMREAISFDIVSIFLDSLPPPDAIAVRRCRETEFTETREGRHITRVFDAVSGRLLRKTVNAPDGRRTLTFEEYPAIPARDDLPGVIVLRNHSFGYTLRLLMQETVVSP